MIITADTIRRFPYAVAPHRITDDLQILIAQDMAERARAEGHRKALPPTSRTNQNDALVAHAKAQAAVYRRLAAGDRTVWQMMQSISMDRAAVDRALAAMVCDGRVKRTAGKFGSRAVNYYAINPEYVLSDAAQIIHAEAIMRSA